jgi:nitroimidazol reductase NimA-like FMN-containing flavoprotein (pyridoxamine 5'-phosphate oxidase superfamily)
MEVGTLVPAGTPDGYDKILDVLFDSGGLEILSHAECRALLDTVPLGRIVFTHAALPAVQPVNFTMAGDDVIIRASQGSKLAAAVRNAVVAFEIDEYDAGRHLGWSVVIVGRAHRVSKADDLALLQDLALTSWAPGRRDDFIRITPEVVTGRRIRPPVAQ